MIDELADGTLSNDRTGATNGIRHVCPIVTSQARVTDVMGSHAKAFIIVITEVARHHRRLLVIMKDLRNGTGDTSGVRAASGAVRCSRGIIIVRRILVPGAGQQKDSLRSTDCLRVRS